MLVTLFFVFLSKLAFPSTEGKINFSGMVVNGGCETRENNNHLDLNCYNDSAKFHNEIAVDHENSNVLGNIIVSKASFKYVQGEKRLAMLSMQYN